jgi:small subunit ribosomal protein S5
VDGFADQGDGFAVPPAEARLGRPTLMNLDAYDTADSGNEVNPIFGDDPGKIPPSVMEEVARFDHVKMDFTSSSEDEAGDGESIARIPISMAHMTAEEQELERERQRLKALFMDPLKLPNKPLFPWSYQMVDVRQTANVLPGGLRNSYKVLVLGGNNHGAIGYGVGKHTDLEVATKLALTRVQDNAIAVSTYRGQLYHDLIGKKHNMLCIIRTRAPGYDGHADDLISWAMQHIGCKYYSGKFTGGNRKNSYTAVQSLFDAFNYIEPYEDGVSKRGLRYVHMTEDRHSPRNRYPQTGNGPSYLGARYKSRTNQK